jgi:hypothetical protein
MNRKYRANLIYDELDDSTCAAGTGFDGRVFCAKPFVRRRRRWSQRTVAADDGGVRFVDEQPEFVEMPPIARRQHGVEQDPRTVDRVLFCCAPKKSRTAKKPVKDLAHALWRYSAVCVRHLLALLAIGWLERGVA